MKRYSFITSCIIALGMAFLWSCNNEETFIDNNPPAEKGKLSFVLPRGGGQTVTYAANSDIDEEFTMSNIRIYWFPDAAGGKLYRRFAHGDNTFAGGATEDPDGEDFTAANGDHQTIVTITVGDYNAASRFYIVANVNGSSTNPDMITSDPLAGVTVNVTTCDEFEALLSDALDAGSVKLIGTPIPMSVNKAAGGAGANGYVKVTDPSQGGTINDIHLKRRVARFDIINTAEYSNFKITRIAVARAQKRGWLFDRPFVEAANSWNADNSYKFEIAVPTGGTAADPLAFNGPAASNVDANGNNIDDAVEADSLHLTKAAFYLYPTILDKNYAKTEIILEGIYNKENTVLYTIDLSDVSKYGAAGELAIEANKLYRIKVIPATEQKLKFLIEVDHWESADTIPTITGGMGINSWGTLTSSKDATLSIDMATSTAANVYEFTTSATDPTKADTLTIATTGTNLTPADVEPDPAKRHTTFVTISAKTGVPAYEASDLQIMRNAQIISKTVKTYGIEYETTHKIVLPPTDAPIEVKLQVANAVNASQDYKVMTLRSNNYAKTGYKPVRVNNTLWAPINVGALILTKVDVDFSANAYGDSITGPHYQWGRNNAAFFPSKSSAVSSAAITTLLWSDDPDTTVFIKGSNDWITPSNDNLWSGPNAQGPCPTGWRVPTYDDWTELQSTANTTQVKKNAYTWYISKTAPIDTLWIPFAGNFTNNGALSGALYNDGGTGEASICWSSTINTADTQTPKRPWRAACQVTTASQLNVSETRSQAMSVRAVRTIIPAP